MKNLLTIIVAVAFNLLSYSATAQTSALNDVDTFLGSDEGGVNSFAIAQMNLKEVNNGYQFEWEALNQINIVRYEIQFSEDNVNFSTVKRVTSKQKVEGKYQVPLNNTIIFADVVYYRVKTVFADGYTFVTGSRQLKIAAK